MHKRLLRAVSCDDYDDEVKVGRCDLLVHVEDSAGHTSFVVDLVFTLASL